jgi:hypothetical protein
LRRAFLTAAVSGITAAPFVRNAATAGTPSIGFWDHWVPEANDVLKAIVEEWASRERVDARIDLISSQGNKLTPTIAAEAQSKTGHDVIPLFRAGALAEQLEPVDDVITENGNGLGLCADRIRQVDQRRYEERDGHIGAKPISKLAITAVPAVLKAKPTSNQGMRRANRCKGGPSNACWPSGFQRKMPATR